MRKNILLLFFFVGLINLGAQSQNPDFTKKFSDAEYHLQYQNFAEALPLYVELANADPNNANVNYKAGFCYLKTPGMADKGIPYLEKAVTNTSRNYEEFSATEKRAPEVAFYDLGTAYQMNMQFDKAADAFGKYKNLVGTKDKGLAEEVERQISISLFAASAVKSPKNITVTSVGGKINSKYPEYTPVLSPDESTLYFTSRREGFGNYQDVDGQYFESIFMSNWKNGAWDEAQLASPNLNVDENDVVFSISQDGSTMLLYQDDKTNDNIWLSESKGESWNTPVMLGANINTKYEERGACMDPDNTIMFFSSNKKGGLGGYDLYMSVKGGDGVWGPAVPCEGLNTKYDETAPYLAADGKSFYFSSDGHETVGGMDLLMSTYDAAAKTFSKPVNLGYPVNTPADETGIVMSMDGKTAYYAGVRKDGQGGSDIFKAVFTDNKASTNVILNGHIINNVEPNATVYPTCKATVTAMSGSGTSKTYTANYATGNFKIALKPGMKYALKVEADGSPIYNEDLDLSAMSGGQEINRDIKLNPNILTEAERAAAEAEMAAKRAAEEAARKAQEEAVAAAKKAEEEAMAKAEKDSKGGKGGKGAKQDNNPRTGATKITDPNTLPLAPLEFKMNFKYNATDIAANKKFNDFVKGLAGKINAGESVTVSIEARASKVPTTKFGTNETLAKARWDSAKEKITSAVKAKGADASKINWGSVDAQVDGPEYNKDFNERRPEYEKFQYVDITIK